VKAEPLENINDIFDRMRTGRIEGRIVVDYHMDEVSVAHENIESLVEA
jgi:hypothetical protein